VQHGVKREAPESCPSSSAADMRSALLAADVPILLMVEVQLTGDEALLDEFAPHIANALKSGVPVPQAMVDRLHQRLMRTLLDPDARSFELTPALFQKMMSTCVGDNVPAEYVPMVMRDLGVAPELAFDKASLGARLGDFRILVIGAGAAGLGAAIQFKMAGLNFDVVEKNADVGGTWFENRYPGAGVDAPNHLYSYSFSPSHSWTRFFVKQKELQAYFRGCMEKYALQDRIHFNTETVSAHYDPGTQKWLVLTRDTAGKEREWRVDCVISAVGQLNKPSIPRIEGLDSFAGQVAHTGQWNEAIDLANKRVAMIGSGASGMQVGPTIAPIVDQLTIFQRSPNWIRTRPRYHETVSAGKRWALEHIPYYTKWYRFQLFWANSDGLHAALQKDPSWPTPERSLSQANEDLRVAWAEYFYERTAGDDTLLAKVLPDYPPFGKRPLLDNNWFEMLASDNVSLVTDGIERIEPDAVVAGGTAYPADVIVFATGFQASRMLFPMDIRGRSGRSLRDLWGDHDPRAYLGMTVPDFPNFFILYGPNTNLGHGGSVIFHHEIQIRYVLGCLDMLAETGNRVVECRRDVHDSYNEKVDAAHNRMVWTHEGVNNWYKNAFGRVTTNSPWRIVDYWKMAEAPKAEDFILEHKADTR
jgi:4-hydroxyacetophenone monooxygenase